jgi:hypothetical protein
VAAETGHFALHADMLPADVRVARYRAVERIGQPYEVSVELDTRDPAFTVDKCLRARLSLEVREGDVVDYAGVMRAKRGVLEAAAGALSPLRQKELEAWADGRPDVREYALFRATC